MKKKGSKLNINGKSYIVTEVVNKSIRCRVCQEHNKCIPCFNPDPKVGSDWKWSTQICKNTIPDNCYLKPEE